MTWLRVQVAQSARLMRARTSGSPPQPTTASDTGGTTDSDRANPPPATDWGIEPADYHAAHAAPDGPDEAAAAGGQPDVSPFAPGGELFRQPDQTTCGSSSLIMAKMINTPAYGAAMLAPTDDGTTDPVVVTKRFDQAVLAMHRTTGGWKDSGGGWQLPWPTQLGTPPWAVARQMNVDGGSGRPGTNYRAQLTNPADLGASYDAVSTAVDAGDCVPLFIGDAMIARHVVLVTGVSDDGLSIYDPSCGAWVNASRDAYVGGTIGVAGWSQPWFVVTPA